MDTQRLRRAMLLFKEALPVAPAERQAFLLERCGGDDDLRERVLAMLAQDDGDAGPVDAAGGGAKVLAAHLSRIGAVADLRSDAPAFPILTGQYNIIRVIGEGGMGTVYEAEQMIPRRRVALKAVRQGVASRHLLKRLEHEAHILGRLHHPGIAQIYDAGAADANHPDQAYFAMEYVEGKPLTDYADERGLGIRERLELIARVCDAVQHAHQRGVIHRDLKPANILVVEEDKEAPATAGRLRHEGTKEADDREPHSLRASPKILDFGVARAIGADLNLSTMHTLTGQLVGTLPYMSPEQISGDPNDVDTRADVYALGVLLYQLMAGRLPHELSTLSLVKAARVIQDETPPRLGTLNPACRGEVEMIVAKAADKERERRYQSAADLASDIRRYLAGEAIEARRDSAVYMLRKTLRRYRHLAATASVAFVLLAAFGVYATIQYRLYREKAREESEMRRKADDAYARLGVQNRVHSIERGRLYGRGGQVRQAEELLWRVYLESPEALDSRWALWELYANNPSLGTLAAHQHLIGTVIVSPDARLIATHDQDGLVKLWDFARRDEIAALHAPNRTVLPQAVAFSPDGGTLAAAGGPDGIVLFDTSKMEVIRKLPPKGQSVDLVAYSPDGRRLVSSGERGVIDVWDVQTGDHLSKLAEHKARIVMLAFNGDGSLLASSGNDATIKVWSDLERPSARTLTGHDGPVTALSFAPGGRTLASGGADRLIKLWDAASGVCQATLAAPNGSLRALRFSRDGGTLYSSGWWTIDTWNVAERKRVRTMPEYCQHFDITPDEQVLVAAHDTDLRFWQIGRDASIMRLSGHQGRVAAAFSPDGRLIATGDAKGVVRLWDAADGGLLRTIEGHSRRVKSLAFSPDGTRLATGGEDRMVRVWNIDTGECLRSFDKHNAQSSQSVHFSADGRLLACTDADGCVRLRDAESGEVRVTLPKAPGELLSVRFAPDGESLATTARSSHLMLWSVSGEPLGHVTTDACPWTLVYTADSAAIGLCGWRNMLQVHDGASAAVRSKLEGHVAVVYGVDWRPRDARVLASASADGTVRLWDVSNRICFLTLTCFDGWDAITVHFSPDGRKLLMAGENSDAQVWDLSYFDRHIAANAEHFIARIQPDLGKDHGCDRVRQWAHDVLSRETPPEK